MPTYNPAAPWATGAEVTDTDTGIVWVASGANSLKKKPVIIASPEDCCHYQEVVLTSIDPNNPPPPVFAPPGKSDGDTLHICYNNGSCYYTCVGGAWILDACKVVSAWDTVLREDCACPSGRGGTTGVGDGKVIRDISVDANGELVIDQVYDHTAITVSSSTASVVIPAQDIPTGFTDSGVPICVDITNNSCRTMTGTLWVEGQLDVSTSEPQCANVEAVVKADRGNGNLANFVNRDVNINITCPHPGESNISNVVSLNKPATVTLAPCETKTICVQLCIEVKQAFSGSIASNVRIRYQGTTR